MKSSIFYVGEFKKKSYIDFFHFKRSDLILTTKKVLHTKVQIRVPKNI